MDDKDEIEVEIVPVDGTDDQEDYEEDIEALEEIASEGFMKTSRPVGFIPVLGLSVMAALLGAIGGALGAQYFIKPPDYTALKSEISQDITRSTDSVSRNVANDLTPLRKDIQTLKRDMSIAINDDTLKNDIANVFEALEARIATLENMPHSTLPEDIAAIKPATLSTLQRAQEAGFNWPDITPLETQLSVLQAEFARVQSELDAVKASPMTVISEEGNPQASIEINGLDLPEFPLLSLLQGAKKNSKPKGLLERTLDKHIRVADPDDPVTLIKKAQKAYDAQEYRAAISAFDQLPAEIKAYGKNWRDAVGAL